MLATSTNANGATLFSLEGLLQQRLSLRKAFRALTWYKPSLATMEPSTPGISVYFEKIRGDRSIWLNEMCQSLSRLIYIHHGGLSSVQPQQMTP